MPANQDLRWIDDFIDRVICEPRDGDAEAPPPIPPPIEDLTDALAAAAIGGLVFGAAYVLGAAVRRKPLQGETLSRARVAPPLPAPPPSIPADVIEAARLLGVGVDAPATEIRAAFRRLVRAEMSAGPFHQDRGGDGRRARRVIAARDLLLARASRAGLEPA